MTSSMEPTEAATSRSRRAARDLVPIGIIMSVVLAAGCVGAWRSGNQEFVFYLVVLVLLMAVVSICHLRVRYSRGILYGMAVWAALHLAGGLVPVPESWPIAGEVRVLYSWWLVPDLLKYDHVVHAFGFGMTTWLCWQSLSRMASTEEPRLGFLLLAVFAGQGLGAMNEVVEFVATLLVPETNVGGYVNTGWDLVANLVGCSGAAILIRWRGCAPPRDVEDERA